MSAQGDLFYAYVKGWADGASHYGYRNEYTHHVSGDIARMYNDGYRVGRQAYKQASAFASELTGYTPSIVRTQTTVTHERPLGDE